MGDADVQAQNDLDRLRRIFQVNDAHLAMYDHWFSMCKKLSGAGRPTSVWPRLPLDDAEYDFRHNMQKLKIMWRGTTYDHVHIGQETAQQLYHLWCSTFWLDSHKYLDNDDRVALWPLWARVHVNVYIVTRDASCPLANYAGTESLVLHGEHRVEDFPNAVLKKSNDGIWEKYAERTFSGFDGDVVRGKFTMRVAAYVLP